MMTKDNSFKPIVAIDLSTSGKGGGPYVNNNRIISSELKNKYEFKKFLYNSELGRGISIKRILDIRKQILKINPDIVHFAGLQLTGFHIAIACKLAKINRSIITIHGFSGDAINFNLLKKIILTFFIEPITLLLTERFYCVSNYVASRFLVRLFNYKNSGVIYNFSPVKYHNAFNNFNIRKELNLLESDFIVVSVGRITKDKGYHILEEVILKLKNEKKLKFIIVGYGNYFNSMEKRLGSLIKKHKVFLLGYREDIQRILNGSDVFILPTLHETLSNALLEASTEGLPLIASNTGGVPEIIENGYNGLLVPPGNASAFVEAIKNLLYNHDLRLFFSKNSEKRNKQFFSSKEIEKQIDRVYTKLLKHN